MVKRTDADVWEQVYTDDRFDELEGLFVEAEKLCAADPDSLRRVKWFREHFFGWMLKVKNEYRSKKRELEDLVWQITPVPKEEKISLDGNLDDAAWSEAKSVTLVPINGEDPLVKTTVSGLWMPDTLYLAYDCRETKIGNLRSLDRKPDERDASQDPSVEFFLLPSSDDTTCSTWRRAPLMRSRHSRMSAAARSTRVARRSTSRSSSSSASRISSSSAIAVP